MSGPPLALYSFSYSSLLPRLLAQEIPRARDKTQVMMEQSTVKTSKSRRKKIKKRILVVLNLWEVFVRTL
jgi:hypothetical protein